MESIHPALRNHVYGAARAPAGLRGEPVIHHLKFLYGLRRQLRASGATEFIVILDPIDVETVAARA